MNMLALLPSLTPKPQWALVLVEHPPKLFLHPVLLLVALPLRRTNDSLSTIFDSNKLIIGRCSNLVLICIFILPAHSFSWSRESYFRSGCLFSTTDVRHPAIVFTDDGEILLVNTIFSTMSMVFWPIGSQGITWLTFLFYMLISRWNRSFLCLHCLQRILRTFLVNISLGFALIQLFMLLSLALSLSQFWIGPCRLHLPLTWAPVSGVL